MNYRIKQILSIFMPVFLVSIAIIMIKDWNQGELLIKNAKGTKLSIKNEIISIDKNEFSKLLWPDNYNLTLEKPGYYYYQDSFEIKRGEKVVISPEFVFIPKIIKSEIKKPFQIPLEKKLKDAEGNSLYTDNQEDIAYLNLPSKILKNLPQQILYIFFSPSGKNAIIITSTDKLEKNIHYYYDVKKAELNPLKPDKILSGFSWDSTGDKFVYFEPIKEGEGKLVLYNTETNKESEITRIYNFKSLYTGFTNKNEKIIILGRGNQQDLISVDIKTGRKEKLTNTNSIEYMKISHDQSGIFFKENKNSIISISFLNLKNRQIYKLPEDYQYLRKIDYLSTLKKIIYTHASESVFDLPEIGDTDSTSQDKYYLYNLEKFQTEILPIGNKENIKVKRYTQIDKTESFINFIGEDEIFYQLKINE